MVSPPASNHAPAGQGPGRQLRLDELGTPLFDTTFVVLDLETTGLTPSTDRITEVGAVRVRSGEVLGELRTFVHPGRPIPAQITAITGISDAMVADAPRIGAVLDHVLEFLRGGVFVAHNARFDLAFLRAASEACGRTFPPLVVVDTARLSRRILRDEVRNHRLGTLARHLKVTSLPEHRALADARATVGVLHGLLERAGSLGATTVEDLVELTRSRSERSYRRRDLVAEAPRSCGVYRFLDGDGRTLYVGKATDLRARLRTYFGQDPRARIADMVRETARVSWQVTPTLLAAEVVELRAIQAERPRYNRRSRRVPAPCWLAWTREPFPRLVVSRSPGAGHRDAVGPFRDARQAEQLRSAVEALVAVRTCTTRLRLRQDHPACVLKDLGRCGAPCDGSQDRDAYAEVVAAAQRLLTDPEPLLDGLQARMRDAAATGRFERAGELRDLRHEVARTLLSLREQAWLRSATRLELAGTAGSGPHRLVLEQGRLVASGPAGGAGGLEPLPAPDEVSDGPASWEELELILAWIVRHGLRALDVDGPAAVPVAGGAALAAAVREQRSTQRAVRRDRYVLTGRKVQRRAPGASGDRRAVG